MVALVGPLAMTGYEPRQARKGATVVADSCAGVWLARAATQLSFYYADGNGNDSRNASGQSNNLLKSMVVYSG